MDANARNELKSVIEHDEDVLVVDVRARDDYEQGHIPGSINVPLASAGFVDEVARQSTGIYQRIVTSCAGGGCDASRRAADQLRAAGFTAVSDYAGGIEQWRREGHPVATGVAAL